MTDSTGFAAWLALVAVLLLAVVALVAWRCAHDIRHGGVVPLQPDGNPGREAFQGGQHYGYGQEQEQWQGRQHTSDGINDYGQRLLCSMNPLLCGEGDGMKVPGKMFFNGKSSSDDNRYYIEKVDGDGDASDSLRLTIDHSLEIWGTNGEQHQLRADGAAAHAGRVVAGYVTKDQDRNWDFNHGMHARHPTTHKWTHFPWKDGKNYIRGDTVVDGTIRMEKHDPGVMLERADGDGKGDRYGIGQFKGGRQRMYTSSANGAATASLSIAQPDGSFNDVLSVGTNEGKTYVQASASSFKVAGDLGAEGTVAAAQRLCVGGTCIDGGQLSGILHPPPVQQQQLGGNATLDNLHVKGDVTADGNVAANIVAAKRIMTTPTCTWRLSPPGDVFARCNDNEMMTQYAEYDNAKRARCCRILAIDGAGN